MTALLLVISGLSLPAGWTFHDLSASPVVRLALGGAVATIKRPEATVLVRILPEMTKPWPDDVASWDRRLIGSDFVMTTKPSRLDRRDGVRIYEAETQSDSESDIQLYTSIIAFDVELEGKRRLIIFSFEDTVKAYNAGKDEVRHLFAKLQLPAVIQDARAPKNLK